MGDITSGTVTASPLGDLWIGTIEHATSSSGSVLGVQEIMGKKIAGITWAQENVGTASPTFSTTSGSVTLGAASTVTHFIAQSKAI